MSLAPKPLSFSRLLHSGLILVLLTIGGTAAWADDTGAQRALNLFREAESVVMDANSVYYLTADQVVTCPPDGGTCTYQLRYNHDFPGEQMEVLPGGTLNIELINRLTGIPVDQLADLSPKVIGSNDDDATKEMIAATSSVTNLHTHGLHVSPAERSDNVMLKITTGKQNSYEVDLPDEHAPGTHWYHAHLHGSTALQVQGGMAGALIVEPKPGESLNPPGFQVQERVMVLQFGAGWEFNEEPQQESQVAEGLVTMSSSDPTPDQALERAKTLEALVDVESLDELLALANEISPEGFRRLADAMEDLQLELPPILVNGQENPVLRLQQDVAVQRFRVVNAGSRFGDYKNLWIADPNNPEVSLPMYVAAIDGVNLTSLPKDKHGNYIAYTKDNPLNLAPGNRADIYFLPEEAGKFALMMEGQIGVRDTEEVLAMAEPGAVKEEPRILKFKRELLTLEVGGPDVGQVAAKAAGRAVGTAPFLDALDERLKELQRTIDAYRDGYLKPFNDGDDYIKRDIVFDVQQGPARPFLINGRSYNAPTDEGHMAGLDDYLGKKEGDGGLGPDNQTPWPLRSGTEEEWTISNESAKVHPFHIHVSPFWVVDIEENGESVQKTNPYDPRLNRWQDTITLPAKGSVTVRHRVSEYTGLYVIHCHILQHEDRGMMINVLTVPHDDQDPEAFFEATKRRNDEINKEINGDVSLDHIGH